MPPDESVGPVWLAVSTTLLILLLITTALRLWVRIARRNVGWDDTTIAMAAVMAAVRYAFGAMQLPHGNGRHRVYLSDHDYKMINMWGWYGQLFHFTSMACLKVSICGLVLRIKDGRALRIFIYSIIAGVLVTNMGVVVVLLAECQPAGFWRGNAAKCWPNKIRIYWIYATIGKDTQWMILCTPLLTSVNRDSSFRFDRPHPFAYPPDGCLEGQNSVPPEGHDNVLDEPWVDVSCIAARLRASMLTHDIQCYGLWHHTSGILGCFGRGSQLDFLHRRHMVESRAFPRHHRREPGAVPGYMGLLPGQGRDNGKGSFRSIGIRLSQQQAPGDCIRPQARDIRDAELK